MVCLSRLLKSGLFLLTAVLLLSGITPAQTKQVSVDSLIYDLKNPDADRRKQAASLLGQNNVRSAVPALIEASSDSDSTVRLEVTRALVRINDRRAVPAYARLIRDDNADIAREAIQGAEQTYVTRETGFVAGVRSVADAVNPFADDFDPVVVEPYERVSPDVIAALAQALSSSDRGIRTNAAATLGTLKGQAALPQIRARLKAEEDDQVTVELIRAVAKIGDTSAGPDLIPLTRASSTKVRDEAIFGLGRLRVKEAVPALTELYSSGIEERKKVLGVPVSGPDEFQKNVFQVLSQIGDPASKELFLSSLTNETAFYRRYGSEGLARIGERDAVTQVGRAFIAEKPGNVRVAMSFALYRLGREENLDELVGNASSGQVRHYFLEFSPQEISKLYPYLSNAKPGIQASLLEVIGLRGDESAMPVVEGLSGSPNASVASAANLAIRRLRGRHG